MDRAEVPTWWDRLRRSVDEFFRRGEQGTKLYP
jgi:hypothetical protein